ncbi:ATP-binding protein [Peribacillus sp. SI8-4]|uniref:ATP-binding protein n=1 Tax=Peribacillus sp. SI8-4 TaxID=3048009 RepID=UPI002554919E|nr:ATP-binding protein [Peribacillus sp. SI8-4]
MTGCIILFIAGTGILFYHLQSLHAEYIQHRQSIVEKQLLVDDILDQYHSVFLNMTAYNVFNKEGLKEQAIGQEASIRGEIEEFKSIASTREDRVISSRLERFSDYYFNDALPSFLASQNISDTQITTHVSDFRSQIKSYLGKLSEMRDDNVKDLTKEQSVLQGLFVGLVLIFLFFFLFIVRSIVKNIGRPLAEFSMAANEIAAGREAVISVNEHRKDELGVLSIAFKKMLSSVQEKEQELMAHNEELMAQQDELHAQQNELQVTLGIIRDNERKLTRRNELINGISSTLDKSEVLKSIVFNMSNIISADRGMIALVHEDASSSFGISDNGVQQFRDNIHSGLNFRLLQEKKAFTIRREQLDAEKGYHENTNYSYDLYLPVLSTFQEVDAIMVYSRYGTSFTDQEVEECETLAKQIATSLDKIKLYEQTEGNRKLNQDILNTIKEGIQLIDQDGKVVQVNQPFCDIFKTGSTPEQVIDLPWDKWSAEMSFQVEGDTFSRSLDEAIQHLEEADHEQRSFIFKKKETNQVIKVYFEALRYREVGFGTILVYRDITKEYEVDQMKSEFVSTVSHELRTPLASVLGFTELMLNKPLKPERQTKYLQTIYNEAKRLTALINDFLDVQKMESGKQVYEKKYVDILPLLQKVIEHLEINTEHHDIQLQIETSDLLILGDRIKIEQAFTNLLSNSIKYSPYGGRIVVRIYSRNDMLVIDIEDEGLGIPKESLPHLFQKFYRVDNSDRRRIGGTGLGLAIVDEIIKSHGGQVTVVSHYGKGSTFTISLPSVTQKEAGLNHDRQSMKLSYEIMVIEDDINLAELLKYELMDSGFHVNYFNSGRRAFEELKKSPPDAIVLDILLEEGEMDGWGILRELKVSAGFKEIPVFISTALDEREKGLSLGAKDYLVKPYKPSQLSKVIMHTLLSNSKKGQILIPHSCEEGDRV